MATKSYLDLSKSPCNQAQHNIFKATHKSVAETFARRFGWPTTKHIHLACNHIESWWVIGQCIGDDMTFLCRDGSTCYATLSRVY